MGFDKTVTGTLFSVIAQDSDVRLPIGTSASGTHTSKPNIMRGTLLWDRAMYVLRAVTVAGGATGGSYTVTVETDAVKGYTGLPIARATIGPNSPGTVVMDSLHQSASSPMPTHLFIDQTSSGATTMLCDVVAKQYRGTLGTPGSVSERVLAGTMIQGTGDGPFTGDAGISVDVTFTLGTSGSNLGMHRMRLWDSALFWAVAGNTIAGTHDVDIIASVGGVTVNIATTGVAGSLNVAGEKLALASNFYGQCPNPTQIIWTETTAGGVSDARVVMMAKSGRGSMAKR